MSDPYNHYQPQHSSNYNNVPARQGQQPHQQAYYTPQHYPHAPNIQNGAPQQYNTQNMHHHHQQQQQQTHVDPRNVMAPNVPQSYRQNSSVYPQGVVIPQAIPQARSHLQTTTNSQPVSSSPVNTSSATQDSGQVNQLHLLLSLAEEYLTAAEEIGAIAAVTQDATELKRYYKLISSGLACIDILLKV
jgi:hypothetical protein